MTTSLGSFVAVAIAEQMANYYHWTALFYLYEINEASANSHLQSTLQEKWSELLIHSIANQHDRNIECTDEIMKLAKKLKVVDYIHYFNSIKSDDIETNLGRIHDLFYGAFFSKDEASKDYKMLYSLLLDLERDKRRMVLKYVASFMSQLQWLQCLYNSVITKNHFVFIIDIREMCFNIGSMHEGAKLEKEEARVVEEIKNRSCAAEQEVLAWIKKIYVSYQRPLTRVVRLFNRRQPSARDIINGQDNVGSLFRELGSRPIPNHLDKSASFKTLYDIKQASESRFSVNHGLSQQAYDCLKISFNYYSQSFPATVLTALQADPESHELGGVYHNN